MRAMDDREIIRRVLSGDKEAFGELVARYKDAVYGVAYHFLGNSHDAQDLAQEVFLQIYRRLPQLRDSSKFRAWLYRITANLCKNWFRKQSSLPEHVQLPYHAQMLEDRRQPSPEQVVEKKERKSMLSQALSTLSDCNQLTLTLFYINGYTYQEVGDFLTVPVGTVKSRLNEARKKLGKEVMKMVKEGLKKERPGEAFVKRFEALAKFPRHEPEVEIEKVPDTGMRITCREFLDWVCKIDGGKTYQAFYDWPERLITSIMVSEITGKRRVEEEDCYELSLSETPQDEPEYKSNLYYTQRGEYYHFVASRWEGKELKTYKDADWQENTILGDPVEFHDEEKVKWLSKNSCQGPELVFSENGVGLAREVAGQYRVKVGGKEYNTLLLLWIVNRNGKKQSKLYDCLAEHYVNENGRLVLFRRYNGPGWSKHKKSSGNIERLKKKDCQSLVYNRVPFYLWYDCIPDHVIV